MTPISALGEELSHIWKDHHSGLTGADVPQGLHCACDYGSSHCIELLLALFKHRQIDVCADCLA